MRISRRAWKAVHQTCILRCHSCTILRAEKWEGFSQRLEVRHHLRGSLSTPVSRAAPKVLCAALGRKAHTDSVLFRRQCSPAQAGCEITSDLCPHPSGEGEVRGP